METRRDDGAGTGAQGAPGFRNARAAAAGLEGLGVLRRSRPENDERTLRLTLTEAGEALKEEALSVPCAMQGCLDLAPDELLQLKKLLDKALKGMENER